MKISLFFIIVSLAIVFAQETGVKFVEPQVVEIGPSSDVVTTAVFPGSVDKKFTVGEVVELVVGFTNNGDKTLNVTSLYASLRYPVDWRVYVQNFTRQNVGVTVGPSEQIDFLYTFRPDPLLDPREFGLAAQVFYRDSENNNYTSFFYNSTIFLQEANEGIDIQLIFTYVGILAVVGLIGFFAYKAIAKATKKSRGPKRPVETGSQKKKDLVVDDEWLQGTSADKKLTKSPKSPRANKKTQ